ncbi:hypothetical protein JMN32_15315 [Fulvivirga sp. 29W222]|uniref:Uncharacterized protein n=1 Tax=Fulvivirga marina TaxID=2494733 RepID=A0A937G3C7_9BACT|nr:hypothetical protein [Fulvivirga marina]MBL6447686.1 hypothetical protein [Fulvivirga marina]
MSEHHQQQQSSLSAPGHKSDNLQKNNLFRDSRSTSIVGTADFVPRASSNTSSNSVGRASLNDIIQMMRIDYSNATDHMTDGSLELKASEKNPDKEDIKSEQEPRKLTSSELKTLLSKDRPIKKIKLLIALGKQHIVLNGSDVVALIESDSDLKNKFANQKTEFEKIDQIEIIDSKLTVSLKEDKIRLDLGKHGVKLQNNAQIDFSELKSGTKILKDRKNKDKVTDIAGSIKFKGVVLKLFNTLGVTPENITFKNKETTNFKDDGSGTFDTYDLQADIEVAERLIPNQNDQFIDYQNISKKE